MFDRDFFSKNKSKALKKLKKAIKAYIASPVDDSDNEHFVYEYLPWIDVRDKAKAFLDELEFDLEAWEQRNI